MKIQNMKDKLETDFNSIKDKLLEISIAQRESKINRDIQIEKCSAYRDLLKMECQKLTSSEKNTYTQAEQDFITRIDAAMKQLSFKRGPTSNMLWSLEFRELSKTVPDKFKYITDIWEKVKFIEDQLDKSSDVSLLKERFLNPEYLTFENDDVYIALLHKIQEEEFKKIVDIQGNILQKNLGDVKE